MTNPLATIADEIRKEANSITYFCKPDKMRTWADALDAAAKQHTTDAEQMIDAFRAEVERADRAESLVKEQQAEIERLRQRLLTAAGDDLCRLTQEEIKAMSAGEVPIPPEEEFLASCKRFHAQVAGTAGVNQNCLTLAQLIAENERLREALESAHQMAHDAAFGGCDNSDKLTALVNIHDATEAALASGETTPPTIEAAGGVDKCIADLRAAGLDAWDNEIGGDA